MTPKHIGLGMTIHQATRSKHLIDLEHLAGYSRKLQMVCLQDALLHHFQRVNHQVTLWLQAMMPRLTVPDPTALGGWRKDESKKCLVPILISKEPVSAICLILLCVPVKQNVQQGSANVTPKDFSSGCAAKDCNNPVTY